MPHDSAVVLQRPLRDGRPRRWLWRGHNAHDAAYVTQWATLAGLDARTLALPGLPPTLGIWEDVSGTGGFDRMNSGNRVYTDVTVTQATRTARGGGPTSWESVLEFYVTDPTYTDY
jgi:hypothetical protein